MRGEGIISVNLIIALVSSCREPQVLSENEVTEIISRVLGTHSTGVYTLHKFLEDNAMPHTVSPGLNRRLPSGDLLNRPAANLLVAVDHFQQGLYCSRVVY